MMTQRQAAIAAATAAARARQNRTVYVPPVAGGCTPQMSRCEDARSPATVLRPCCRQHIIDIFRAMDRLLSAAGVTWWLDYGSILGAVRNPMLGIPPGIVPKDKDGDCGFLGEHWAAFVALKPAIEAEGFSVIVRPLSGMNQFNGGHSIKVRRSMFNHTNVDFFPWYPRKSMPEILERKRYIMADHYKGREFPTDKLLPLRLTEWEGMQLPVPAEPEWFAELRYSPGNDGWKQPINAYHGGVKIADGAYKRVRERGGCA